MLSKIITKTKKKKKTKTKKKIRPKFSHANVNKTNKNSDHLHCGSHDSHDSRDSHGSHGGSHGSGSLARRFCSPIGICHSSHSSFYKDICNLYINLVFDRKISSLQVCKICETAWFFLEKLQQPLPRQWSLHGIFPVFSVTLLQSKFYGQAIYDHEYL